MADPGIPTAPAGGTDKFDYWPVMGDDGKRYYVEWPKNKPFNYQQGLDQVRRQYKSAPQIPDYIVQQKDAASQALPQNQPWQPTTSTRTG